MEHKAVAQRDGPGSATVLDDVAVNHLRLRIEAFVKPIKLVEHQEAVIARYQASGENRVQQREVGLRHKPHGLACACRSHGRRSQADGRGGQERTTLHLRKPLVQLDPRRRAAAAKPASAACKAVSKSLSVWAAHRNQLCRGWK